MLSEAERRSSRSSGVLSVMTSRFSLATLFHVFVLAATICFWVTLVQLSVVAWVVFVSLMPIGVPYAVLCGIRTRGRAPLRILVSMLFYFGWSLLAGYATLASIGASDVAFEDEWYGLDQLVARACIILFLVPACLVVFLMYRRWVWSCRDNLDAMPHDNGTHER